MTSYDQELQLHQINKVPFFEGWYYRFVDENLSVAVIIGIAKTKEKQVVFIQIFHTLNQVMEKVYYDIKELKYQEVPFMITLKKSIFKGHHIHIEDERLSTILDLDLDRPTHISQSKYAPTIMGPFAYIKNMQCNHAIINLECHTTGYLIYNNQTYDLKGIIYQEKDWGTSFPKKYIWIQSNCCQEKKAIIFLSCATIPLKKLGFTGVIMTLIINGKEYKFASYYGAYVAKAQKVNNKYNLTIRQGKFLIVCTIEMGPIYTLDAPHSGQMVRNVQESLLGHVKVELYEYKQCKEELSFYNCGIENDSFFI